MANDSLEISLDVLGLAQSVNALSRVASSVESVGGSTQNLLGFGGGVAAVGAVVAGTVAASNDLLQFARLQGQLAATTQETAQMRIFGSVLGFDPASMANALRAAGNQGLGAPVFAKAGVDLRPMDVNNRQDLAQNFVKVMDMAAAEFARGLHGQAAADLKNVGLEAQTQILPVWRQVRAEVVAAAQSIQAVYTEQEIVKAERLRIATSVLGAEWSAFTTSIMGALIPALTAMTHEGNKMLGLMGQQGEWEALGQMFGEMAKGVPFARAREDARKSLGIGTGDSHKAATDANTRALEDNTFSVRNLARGMFGGGARTRTAIPGQFFGAGAALRDAYAGAAKRLGAYSVSL